MLKNLSKTMLASLFATTGLAVLPPSATAASPCPGAGSGGGQIDVCAGVGIEVPGSGGSGSTGGSGSGGNAPLPDVNCPQVGGIVICPDGQDSPQPAAHTPTIFLASSATDSLGLPFPGIHYSPDPTTYVRLKTRLWIDRDDFATFTATATAPAGELEQVVTATAEPLHVIWNTGESRIQCNNAGGPNSDGCIHTYNRSSKSQPNNAYNLSATITWRVNWTCEGIGCDNRGGALDNSERTASELLVVREVQTETNSRQ